MSIVLALAAVLNAQPTPTPCIPDLQARPSVGTTAATQPSRPCSQPKPILMAFSDASTAEPTPNLYRQPTRCGPLNAEVVRWIEASAPSNRMAAQYAVMRSVDGCGVPTPVGFHQTYLVPSEPVVTETIRRADAPARRR